MKHSLFIGLLLSFSMTNISCSTAQPKKNTDALLHYVVRAPKGNQANAPVLVLLHGYGSNEQDLFSFAGQIPEHWLVVSARAPFALGANQYKWYDVQMLNNKITLDLKTEEQSRKQLLNLIDHVVLKYKANKNKVVTAGFSQGANMSVGLLLTAPDKIKGAGCFSGRFMEEIKPLIQNKTALKNRKVFLGHGTKDDMLPMRYANENKATIESYGIKVEVVTDQIAHAISNKEMTAFVAWLGNL